MLRLQIINDKLNKISRKIIRHIYDLLKKYVLVIILFDILFY